MLATDVILFNMFRYSLTGSGVNSAARTTDLGLLKDLVRIYVLVVACGNE